MRARQLTSATGLSVSRLGPERLDLARALGSMGLAIGHTLTVHGAGARLPIDPVDGGLPTPLMATQLGRVPDW
eukprot:9979523-Alexandrium_andersonii.AAC.1